MGAFDKKPGDSNDDAVVPSHTDPAAVGKTSLSGTGSSAPATGGTTPATTGAAPATTGAAPATGAATAAATTPAAPAAAAPAAAPNPLGDVTKALSAGGAAGATAAFDLVKAMPAAQQSSIFTQLTAAQRKDMADHLQYAQMSTDVEKTALRRGFDATPAAEVDTLSRWMELRFRIDVKASTDPSGKPWDKVGLRRSWDVLQNLPTAHVEGNKDLSSLTRYDSSDIEGWAADSGEAAMGYGGTTDPDKDLEHGDFTDPGDPLFGKNIFDSTVRHEIGHRVDAGVGGPNYTKTADGGEWEEWNGSAGVAQRMVNASNGKIHGWKDAGEKTAIIHCLQSVIDDRAPGDIDARLEALAFTKDHATDKAHKAKLDDILADDAVNALRVAFSDQGPWFTATGGVVLGGRIFQESYDWPQWVSYKQSARQKKFSLYQFRAPGEWFAEAYATYYQPPGTKGALMTGLDDTTKAWFDKNVDPQHGKGATGPQPAAATPAAPASGTPKTTPRSGPAEGTRVAGGGQGPGSRG